VPSPGSGSSEYLLRPSPLDIFRREEAGKVPADNLIGCVTFDSFGAGIPTENPALRVHHENGIVLDSIEEHPISFFAFSERLGQFASGAVTLGGSSRGNGTWNRE